MCFLEISLKQRSHTFSCQFIRYTWKKKKVSLMSPATNPPSWRWNVRCCCYFASTRWYKTNCSLKMIRVWNHVKENWTWSPSGSTSVWDCTGWRETSLIKWYPGGRDEEKLFSNCTVNISVTLLPEMRDEHNKTLRPTDYSPPLLTVRVICMNQLKNLFIVSNK